MRTWMLIALAPVAALAESPARIQDGALTAALAFGTDLVPMYQGNYYRLRLMDVPETDGECWGKETSCPKHTLYLAVLEGELYPTTAVYRLGVASGWEFLGWKEPCSGKGTVGFSVRTNLPGANVDQDNRNAWRPTTLTLCIDGGTPMLISALPNQPLHPTPTAAKPASGAGERRR